MTVTEPIAETIISTSEWCEEHDPFKVYCTETKIGRGNDTIKRTIKRFTGPIGPIKRLNWKKFGAAGADPTKITSRICEDVDFELKNPIKYNDNWVSNGMYITLARADNWSDVDITKITKSDHPDQVYSSIYLGKVKTMFAEYDTIAMKKAMAKAKAKGKPMAKIKAVDLTGMGLRERFLMKQKMRNQGEDTLPGPKSLSSLMNKRREAKNETEHLCTLFAENVPLEYQETDIKQELKDYDVLRVSVVRRDGEPVGKAFIELENAEEAADCLKFIDGSHWGHSVISVQFSRPKPKDK